jgi:monoamine oxidase
MQSAPLPDGDLDVAIVGAGFAGLAAASALAQAGKRVMVLEAQDRVGGRVRSDRAPDGKVYEQGGQFFNRNMPCLMALIEQQRLTIRHIRQSPGTVLLSGGRLSRGGRDGCLTEAFWTELAATAPEAHASIGDWLSSPPTDAATTAMYRSGRSVADRILTATPQSNAGEYA